jgi:hypothetical protein
MEVVCELGPVCDMIGLDYTSIGRVSYETVQYPQVACEHFLRELWKCVESENQNVSKDGIS